MAVNLHHELFLMRTGLDRVTIKPPMSVAAIDTIAALNPPGQWWERMGYVVILHPNIDPNDDPEFQGWVRVTEDRAREVLESQA